jgi:hypothetical protein
LPHIDGSRAWLVSHLLSRVQAAESNLVSTMGPTLWYALGVIFVILSGITMALQPGANASLGRAAGSRGFASVISFVTGLAVCVIFMLVESAALQKPLPHHTHLKGMRS